MKIQLQYPDQSLNGRRLEALRGYFGDNLERVMIQAMWSVVGPLGSSLAELPEKEIQGHINGGKLHIKGFHQEALDLIGGGEVTSEVTPEVTPEVTKKVTPEQSPSAAQEPVYLASTPEQSGDPLNNLF
ncbi:hypothetical protein HRE53_31990 (plasmid) [Acaryochloris sp. 'Moss Beach']|nr:hypothetical protein HRE53_31990 [Acaryochloris sp. 'Moss Beach']